MKGSSIGPKDFLLSEGGLSARRTPDFPPRLERPERAMVLFLSRWIKAPHLIGALAPSSRYLARAMARQMVLDGEGPVIELGGGTGSITRALLAAGLPPGRLIVVERDATLAALLRKGFPGVKVLRGDAAQLVALLAPLGIARAASVVSSLPLLSMPKRLRRCIVEESFALLGEEGAFVQFTYGLASPLAGPEFRVSGEVAQRVWRNFPPAAVWRFRRPDVVKMAKVA